VVTISSIAAVGRPQEDSASVSTKPPNNTRGQTPASTSPGRGDLIYERAERGLGHAGTAVTCARPVRVDN
jgi:hypothetical protein